MKTLTFLSFFICFALKAEVSRSPAVVGGLCDLDIPTTKIKPGSEKVFGEEVVHKVVILSDDQKGCSVMPKKQYPNSVYEEFARNEMKVLFQKYPDNYSRKCADHFKKSGLKMTEFSCEEPVITSMTFERFGCEKENEEVSGKINYVGFAHAKVTYQQRGLRIEEKSLEALLKEQCTRVNECMEQASENEMPELTKLAVVACKNELTPVNSGRAPAIEKDSSNFDGKRLPKPADPKAPKAPAVPSEDSTTIRK